MALEYQHLPNPGSAPCHQPEDRRRCAINPIRSGNQSRHFVVCECTSWRGAACLRWFHIHSRNRRDQTVSLGDLEPPSGGGVLWWRCWAPNRDGSPTAQYQTAGHTRRGASRTPATHADRRMFHHAAEWSPPPPAAGRATSQRVLRHQDPATHTSPTALTPHRPRPARPRQPPNTTPTSNLTHRCSRRAT